MADAIWNDRYILSNMTSEKLYAKSPLTTGVSGTSAYIGLEPSATYNETVLYEDASILSPNTWPGDTAPGSRYFTLIEDYKNFEKLQINFARNASLPCDGINYIDTDVMHMTNDTCVINTTFIADNDWYNCATLLSADSGGTRITEAKGYQKSLAANPGTGWVYMHVYKVVGINRKENA